MLVKCCIVLYHKFSSIDSVYKWIHASYCMFITRQRFSHFLTSKNLKLIIAEYPYSQLNMTKCGRKVVSSPLWRSVSKLISITCTKLASAAELMNQVTLYRCADCDSVCVLEQDCQKQIQARFGKYIFFNSSLFFCISAPTNTQHTLNLNTF